MDINGAAAANALTKNPNAERLIEAHKGRNNSIFARAAETTAPDTVSFGTTPLSAIQTMNIVVDRSIEQLRAVLGEAAAELGIPEGGIIDTSPEATAQRILDFAFGAFDAFRSDHEDLDDDGARSAFRDLIGGAIEQGINEARDILTALSALSPDVNTDIDTISTIIQERLDAFAANE